MFIIFSLDVLCILAIYLIFTKNRTKTGKTVNKEEIKYTKERANLIRNWTETVKNAKKEILILTYSVWSSEEAPDGEKDDWEKYLEAIQDAVERRVTVRLIGPKKYEKIPSLIKRELPNLKMKVHMGVYGYNFRYLVCDEKNVVINLPEQKNQPSEISVSIENNIFADHLKKLFFDLWNDPAAVDFTEYKKKYVLDYMKPDGLVISKELLMQKTNLDRNHLENILNNLLAENRIEPIVGFGGEKDYRIVKNIFPEILRTEKHNSLMYLAASKCKNFNFSQLYSREIIRDPLSYAFIYQYPPPASLPDIDESTIFTNYSGNEKKNVGLYLHIPFCTGKCSYCYYISSNAGDEEKERYIGYLRKEVEMMTNKEGIAPLRANSIHIGGGTPSCLNEKQLTEIINILTQNVDFNQSPEFTVEVSPETVLGDDSESKLEIFKNNGVNRLSIGVQSFDDDVLKRVCNRRHDSEEASKAFLKARELDFKNINIDIIYGLPNQSLESWEQTLKKAIELNPESVSVYHLRINPKSKIIQKFRDGLPGRDTVLLMYVMASEKLSLHGYKRIISNKFVKDNKYQHHQLASKRGKNSELIGFGVSAYSYLNNCVYYNHLDKREYYSSINSGNLPINIGKKLSKEDQMERVAILSLQSPNGIDKDSFKTLFSKEPDEAFRAQIETLIEFDLLEDNGDFIRFTDKGMVFGDEICLKFFNQRYEAYRKSPGYGMFFNTAGEEK